MGKKISPNSLHKLVTHLWPLIMQHNIANENEAVEAHIQRHRDSKIKS